ncbi:MAG: ribosomal protein S18-alanine N-acetyltransferase [Calditrichia bacterium]
MAKVHIRRMTLDDLDYIMPREVELFTDPWSRRSYEFEVSRNRFSLPVVITKDHVMIGYSVIWKLYEEFHIATFAIFPEYQGQGWGSYFMTQLLNEAFDSEIALLEVRKSNHAAIALYRKFGFSTVRVRPRYYKNGEDALLMQRILKGPVPDSIKGGLDADD